MLVLQPWLDKVGLKQQSILQSGFRNPDHKTVAIKKCVRWMRAQCQINADPTKQGYMQDITMDDALIEAAMDELEYCAVHYAHHFADAFAVVAFHHPDEMTRHWAGKIYYEVADELFHFHCLTKTEFTYRHRDKI